MSAEQPGQQPPSPQEQRATPLVGYRDIPQPTGRRGTVASWLILGAMTVGYLIWTLVVYFFEPGIR
jgi:hypothetical protein